MITKDIYQPLKYARIEEERRFLLRKMPDALNSEKSYLKIIDRYISGTRLRLRRIEAPSGKVLVYKLGQKYQTPDQKAYQTIMTNIYLNEAEYKTVVHLAALRIIKRRYPYQHERLDFSIDVFEGHLKGLCLAEIESQNNLAITLLPVPAFAIREVTDDPFFSGGKLVELTEVEFQQWLTTI